MAWLEGQEPARSRVEAVLDGGEALMSWINAGEVAYVLDRAAGEARARRVVAELRARATLELPSEPRILAAAAVKARHAMAFADAFACATALAHHSVLLTGDPEILEARGLGLSVEDLRRPGPRRAAPP